MGFLFPGFLSLLALTGLPVWLHLLKRHRSQPLDFSSLMLFERHALASVKSRKLDYLMLLALRLAILILVALAFAQPFVRRTLPAAAAGRGRLVVVVDDSASMAAQNRMEAAKDVARGLLRGASAVQRTQVAVLDSRLRIMTQPDATRDQHLAAVESMRAGTGRSSYGEFARAVRGLQQTAQENLDVHLISDMQRSSLPGGFTELRLDDTTKLTLHPVGSGTPANFSIENVRAPRIVSDTKTVKVEALVAGYHNDPAELGVTLLVNDKPSGTQSVKVDKNGRARVQFLGLDVPFGWSRCAVRVESRDAVEADNTFLFSVERADPRRILFLAGDRAQRSTVYFRSALEASAENLFTVESWPASAPPAAVAESTAFVVLSDAATLNPAFEGALDRYVRAGGGLWIFLGAGAGGKVPVSGVGLAASQYAGRGGDRYFTYASGDETHPALRASQRWEGVRFFQYTPFDAAAAKVVARLNDGSVILAEQRLGEGRILLFGSTLDNVANDFPLHAAFLPFVEQTAQYLAGLEDRPAQYRVDDALELRQDQTRAATVEVFDPNGVRALSLSEAAKARSVPLEQAGFYEVRRGAGRRELIAVNIDRRESDLTPLPEESIALWQGPAETKTAGGGGVAADRGVETRNFGWGFLWAALAAALAEGWLAARHLSRQEAR